MLDEADAQQRPNCSWRRCVTLSLSLSLARSLALSLSLFLYVYICIYISSKRPRCSAVHYSLLSLQQLGERKLVVDTAAEYASMRVLRARMRHRRRHIRPTLSMRLLRDRADLTRVIFGCQVFKALLRPY